MVGSILSSFAVAALTVPCSGFVTPSVGFRPNLAAASQVRLKLCRFLALVRVYVSEAGHTATTAVRTRTHVAAARLFSAASEPSELPVVLLFFFENESLARLVNVEVRVFFWLDREVSMQSCQLYCRNLFAVVRRLFLGSGRAVLSATKVLLHTAIEKSHQEAGMM